MNILLVFTLYPPDHSHVFRHVYYDFRNKSHVWYAGMTTYNALVAFIIYMIKIKAICDHGDLTK